MVEETRRKVAGAHPSRGMQQFGRELNLFTLEPPMQAFVTTCPRLWYRHTYSSEDVIVLAAESFHLSGRRQILQCISKLVPLCWELPLEWALQMDVVVGDTCSIHPCHFLLKLALGEGIGVPYPTDKALYYMSVEFAVDPWFFVKKEMVIRCL